jgi:hypothetical protein
MGNDFFADASTEVGLRDALPDWVRGRGLAMLVTVFFGAMTAGSALWGHLPRRSACLRPTSSPPPALSSESR